MTSTVGTTNVSGSAPTGDTAPTTMMTTGTRGNDTGGGGGTGPGEGEGEDIDIGMVAGLAGGLGVLLLAGAILLAVGLRGRRRTQTPKKEDRPRQSIAFYQAVGAVRPADVPQTGKGKQNPSRMGAPYRPQMSNHRPVAIDNRAYDLYCDSARSGACFSPYDRQHQPSVAY